MVILGSEESNMLKIEKEYRDMYGDIPDQFGARLEYLLTMVNLSRCRQSIFEEIDRIRNIKWIHHDLTINILPKATPRPRASSVNGKHTFFYVKGAADNKKLFKKYMEDNQLNDKIPLIYTPTKFHVKAYFPIPKSMTGVEKVLAELGLIRHIVKPDFDNLVKTYSDMITGIVLYDDAIIVEGSLKKYYSLKPRIEISISYMESFDSSFNERKLKGKE